VTLTAEICVRIACGPVVGRLGGGVDDQGDVLAELAEQVFDRLTVADVEVVMLIIREGLDEFLAVAERGRFLAEKPLAQVIVNANDFEIFAREAFDAFRTDQARGAGDNHSFHEITCSPD